MNKLNLKSCFIFCPELHVLPYKVLSALLLPTQASDLSVGLVAKSRHTSGLGSVAGSHLVRERCKSTSVTLYSLAPGRPSRFSPTAKERALPDDHWSREMRIHSVVWSVMSGLVCGLGLTIGQCVI
ncbi:hypothetical protein RRG08_013388 [Elysia crispata]|uniref:Uncharacterized protein n=1 Tax=Elysia crispata TaxID=231223 RepID=A0AAE1B8D7_9GAST|nr:hypothetical protein RRG08_013388 [Elysia crispata]